MKNKLIAAALGALTLGLISVPCANAGTEEIQDYGGRQVAPPRYSYAPPRRAYYAPPIGVAVYPRFGYYRRPWRRAYGFHRPYYWRHRRGWH